MPFLRLLLIVFGLAVVALVGLFFFRGDRKYLRRAGRLFLIGIGAAVLFFAILLLQRFA